jgi:hypothetical protein
MIYVFGVGAGDADMATALPLVFQWILGGTHRLSHHRWSWLRKSNKVGISNGIQELVTGYGMDDRATRKTRADACIRERVPQANGYGFIPMSHYDIGHSNLYVRDLKGERMSGRQNSKLESRERQEMKVSYIEITSAQRLMYNVSPGILQAVKFLNRHRPCWPSREVSLVFLVRSPGTQQLCPRSTTQSPGRNNQYSYTTFVTQKDDVVEE